jgi:long-chain acyl-CoA synthetase
MPLSEPGLLCDGAFLARTALTVRALCAASLLADHGVGAGDSIALLLRNQSEFLEATLAAQHLGAYAVPVNWHFTAPEALHVVQDCGARVLVAAGDLASGLADQLPDGIQIFTTEPPGVGSEGWAGLWSAALEACEPHAGPAHPPVQSMIYTSGTTGRPKGVRRASPRPDQAHALARIRTQVYEPRPGMRALLAAPLYHSAPNVYALSTLRSEGLLVLQRKFDPEATLRTIAEHRITHMFAVPTMFVRLLALPREVRVKYDLSSLCSVVHAGAPCSPFVKAAMIDWWGPVITEYYGSTELGPLTFCNAADWLAHPGTVGRALDGVSLSIRNDAGAACAIGEPGEIYARNSVQPDFTYHGDPAKREALATPAGLATGDVGYLDDEGYLFLCDRRTDMIISGGVNIYPAEVEAALLTVAGVRDCAVVGAPDPEFGETVAAFIECDPAATLSERHILAALRDILAGYKTPQRIAFVETLPRDDSGKIFKRRLRQALANPAQS